MLAKLPVVPSGHPDPKTSLSALALYVEHAMDTARSATKPDKVSRTLLLSVVSLR